MLCERETVKLCPECTGMCLPTVYMHVLVEKRRERQNKTVFVCVCVRVCAFSVVVAKMPPSS